MDAIVKVCMPVRLLALHAVSLLHPSTPLRPSPRYRRMPPRALHCLPLQTGECVPIAFTPYSADMRPIQHVRVAQGSPVLGTGWVTKLLKLGGYEDLITVPSGVVP